MTVDLRLMTDRIRESGAGATWLRFPVCGASAEIGYIIVSIVSGILFGILDGVINANLLAQRLYEVCKPIAKTSINPAASMVIDLVYGFVMAGVFLLLYKSLPGETDWSKGRAILARLVALWPNSLLPFIEATQQATGSLTFIYLDIH